MSRIFDTLIERVHTGIGWDPAAVSQDLVDAGLVRTTEKEYFRIALALAAFRRVERMDLGERILEKARRADTDPKGFSYFGYLSRSTNTAFVFLASRIPDPVGRIRVLQNLSEAAFVLHQPDRLVGIATHNFSAPAVSTNFLVLEDFDPVDRDDLLKKARRLFADAEELVTDEWGSRY